MKFKFWKKFLFIAGSVILLILLVSFIILRDNPNLSILSPISKSFSILAFANKRQVPKKIIYGYLPYWTLDKIKYFQLDKLTDIAYFGLNIDENGNFVTRDLDGNVDPGYNKWRNSKELNKLIKDSKKNNVRFALTVISHRDDISDKFLDCRECWNTLADNVIKELVEKDIKDVNLNFEYVEYTSKEKAHQYTEFVAFLNGKLDEKFGDSKLVVSTFADSIVKNRVTRIDELAKVADRIFIMGYDFHSAMSASAGPVAPIGGMGKYSDYDISTMLHDYLAYVPPTKIILGVPYYGYNWVVQDQSDYARRVDGSDSYGYSKSQSYEDIMNTIIDIKPELKWDDVAKAPYFTYISEDTGITRQVYYENVKSLKEKYDLVKKMKLAGVGMWALGYDGGYKDLWDLLEEEFITN